MPLWYSRRRLAQDEWITDQVVHAAEGGSLGRRAQDKWFTDQVVHAAEGGSIGRRAQDKWFTDQVVHAAEVGESSVVVVLKSWIQPILV